MTTRWGETGGVPAGGAPALPYCGGWLDRVAGRRADPCWLERVRRRPDSRLLPLWRDRCLVARGRPTVLPAATADSALTMANQVVFLGLDGPAGVFAVDLSTLSEERAAQLTGGTMTVDVRALVGSLTPAEAAVLAYARGLLHWHRNQRFCGSCGGGTQSQQGGHIRVCQHRDCGRELYPRIEPAVITLVEAPVGTGPARCLLGRHRGSSPDGFTTLAGFVDVGESLEDAVRREVAEETGVLVGDVTYQGSQAWPFPAGLMVGFRARAVSERIEVDGVEVLEARWFGRAELRERLRTRGPRGLYRDDSIQCHLMETWLTESD